MKYEDITCGLRVRLPDGRVGKVDSYDASMALSFGGSGGFQRRNVRNLKATVKIEGTSDEKVDVLITKLNPVE